MHGGGTKIRRAFGFQGTLRWRNIDVMIIHNHPIVLCLNKII